MSTINSEFFEALALLEKERGIPMTYLIEKISNAIAVAIKRDMGGSENTIVEIDPVKRRFYVAVRKQVVEEVEDPENEITLQDATKYSKVAHVGGMVEIPLETKQFGRIAAQSAKHVIRQGISEAEKGQLVQKYQDKKYEIISVPVLKIDEVKGNATVEIDKSEAILPKSEQVPGEVLHEGQRIMVYVVDVLTGGKNPKLMISRTHPGLIKRLFEMHTPEIKDGTVEIMAVSREAGSRTKIAVWSNDPDVDAVGACVGMNGARVNAVVEELRGEKIDIINWDENPAILIENALSPAKVIAVMADPDEKTALVVVPDYQLSLAIGKEGQNARLAARLTGFKIDIKSETQAKEAGDFYDYDDDETAEDAAEASAEETSAEDSLTEETEAEEVSEEVPVEEEPQAQEAGENEDEE